MPRPPSKALPEYNHRHSRSTQHQGKGEAHPEHPIQANGIDPVGEEEGDDRCARVADEADSYEAIADNLRCRQ